MSRIISFPIALVLAVLMHTDWHLARAGHHLGLGWRYHWLLAIPVFAAGAAWMARKWPEMAWRRSAATVMVAIVLAGVVEPLGEVIHYHTNWSDAFGEHARWVALTEYVAVGLLAGAITLAGLLWRRAPRPAP
jgi:hypothetical protein